MGSGLKQMLTKPYMPPTKRVTMIDISDSALTAAAGRARNVAATRAIEHGVRPAGIRPGRWAAESLKRGRHARTSITQVASDTMSCMRNPRGAGPRTASGGGDSQSETLRIGLLAALTGPLAPVERSIHDASLLAIDEVNASGGVAGRQLEPVSADYASDTTRATFEATRLLREEGIKLLAGGYTSASRVAIQPALHKHNGLLLYPTYYEGLESDPRTLYAGAVPNQFLAPFLEWVLAHLGDRVALIGSDYSYPRTAGAIATRLVTDHGGTVLSDHYVPLGQTDFGEVIAEIARVRPSVVISNLVGNDSVPAFYRAYHSAGLRAESEPIAATVTTELDLGTMGPVAGVGHYMTGSYFSTVDGPANRGYLKALRSRTGTEPSSHAAEVGAYNAIHLLAAAAERVTEPDSAEAWLSVLPGSVFAGSPEEYPITVSADLHTTHPAHIGRADENGRFTIIKSWPASVPDPYPALLLDATPSTDDGVSATAPSG
jgi:urea transport system substrate-binding protein